MGLGLATIDGDLRAHDSRATSASREDGHRSALSGVSRRAVVPLAVLLFTCTGNTAAASVAGYVENPHLDDLAAASSWLDVTKWTDQVADEQTGASNADAAVGNDDTAALQSLFTYVMEVLVVQGNNRPRQHVVIYFPEGEYRIRDTLVFPTVVGKAYPAFIRIVGDSRSDVRLVLASNQASFADPEAPKPMLSFWDGVRPDPNNAPNVSFHNSLENMTLDVGAGNDGAVGVLLHTNNAASFRNVLITHSDPADDATPGGRYGVWGRYDLSGTTYIHHVRIEGFAEALRLNGIHPEYTLEHVEIENQHEAGIVLNQRAAQIRDLTSVNDVPAIRVVRPQAHLLLLESTLSTRSVSSPHPAIEFEDLHTHGYLRDVAFQGYQVHLRHVDPVIGEVDFAGDHANQWVASDAAEPATFNHGGIYKLWSDAPDRGNIVGAVQETPQPTWEPSAAWTVLSRQDLSGRAKRVLSSEIQAAIDDGATTIIIGGGSPVVFDGMLVIRNRVRRIHFGFADFSTTTAFDDDYNTPEVEGLQVPLMRIGDFGHDEPVVIEALGRYLWGGNGSNGRSAALTATIENLSANDLVVRDCDFHRNQQYRNFDLFDQERRGTGVLFWESSGCDLRWNNPNQPYEAAFHIKNQEAWIRNYNNELRGAPKLKVEGGSLWLFGFKTETEGEPLMSFTQGARVEVLGGILNLLSSASASTPGSAMFEMIDAEAAVIALERNLRDFPSPYEYAVVETVAGTTRQLSHDLMPRRYGVNGERPIVVPMYRSRPQMGIPPTVVEAIAAAANPVTETSVALSVLGDDDEGESGLRYHWSARGPEPVVFSVTGSNGAKLTTARFQRAGDYRITVEIRDQAGLSVGDSLDLRVESTPQTLRVEY